MRTPVKTISPEAGLDRALVMMRTQRIRHLPVVEDGALVGLITDRDLRFSMVEMEGPDKQPKGLYLPALTKVRAVMKTELITAAPEDELPARTRQMADRKIGCLPVLETGTTKLVGIVTETDLLKYLARLLEEKEA
ncbi:MAG: CBS domain-containing protein [Planctomycetota bacterium]|nr:CBS domain-containing protein [Planctomycetota bacterium]